MATRNCFEIRREWWQTFRPGVYGVYTLVIVSLHGSSHAVLRGPSRNVLSWAESLRKSFSLRATIMARRREVELGNGLFPRSASLSLCLSTPWLAFIFNFISFHRNYLLFLFLPMPSEMNRNATILSRAKRSEPRINRLWKNR